MNYIILSQWHLLKEYIRKQKNNMKNQFLCWMHGNWQKAFVWLSQRLARQLGQSTSEKQVLRVVAGMLWLAPSKSGRGKDNWWTSTWGVKLSHLVQYHRREHTAVKANAGYEIKVSEHTLHHSLLYKGMCRSVITTPLYHRKHLRWVCVYYNCTMEQWKKMVWLDRQLLAWALWPAVVMQTSTQTVMFCQLSIIARNNSFSSFCYSSSSLWSNQRGWPSQINKSQ